MHDRVMDGVIHRRKRPERERDRDRETHTEREREREREPPFHSLPSTLVNQIRGEKWRGEEGGEGSRLVEFFVSVRFCSFLSFPLARLLRG